MDSINRNSEELMIVQSLSNRLMTLLLVSPIGIFVLLFAVGGYNMANRGSVWGWAIIIISFGSIIMGIRYILKPIWLRLTPTLLTVCNGSSKLSVKWHKITKIEKHIFHIKFIVIESITLHYADEIYKDKTNKFIFNSPQFMATGSLIETLETWKKTLRSNLIQS